MYLKNLELYGFKSFANRTKIDFTDGITGVVGPNGSGKSNIIDAIMWALGETSAKQLRGSKMEDVIFGGTGKKNALGFAEVILSFDNKDQYLKIPYEEVSIRRKMYRSGESEFYINKQKVRLKDIREMFMDTGIGKDGYSFIGQGQIEQILSNRPQDRRLVFEEAAGISKYKSRKDESKKSLEKTLDNIQRLDDILKEVIFQEEKLKEEKLVTEDYFEKKEEKDNVYGQILLKKEQQFDEDKQKLVENLRQVKCKIEETRIKRSNLENKKSQLKEKENKNRIKEVEYHNDKLEYIKTLESIRGQKQTNDSLLSEAEKNCKDLEFRQEDSREKLLEMEKKIHTNEDKRAQIVSELEKSKKEFSDKEIIWKKLQEEHKKEKDVELNYNIREKDWIEKSSSLKSKIDSIQYFLKEKIERKAILIDQLNKLSQQKKELDKEIASKNLSLREKESQLKECDQGLHIVLEVKDNLLTKKHAIESEKLEAIKQIENVDREMNFLKKVHENNEGYSQTVRNFLRYLKNFPELNSEMLGPVADNIIVEKNYEAAISVALGAGAQNIILKDDKNVGQMIDILKEKKFGRLTFYPINTMEKKSVDSWVKSKTKVNFELAIDKISFDPLLKPVLSNLLGRILVVDNLEDGKRLSRDLDRRYKIVSKSGDVFQVGGSISGGNIRSNQIDLYNRKSEIQQKEILKKEKDLLRQELESKQNIIENDLFLHEKKIEDLQKEKAVYIEDISRNINLLQNLDSAYSSTEKRYLEIQSEIKKEENLIRSNEELLSNYSLDLSQLEKEKINQDTAERVDLGQLEEEVQEAYEKLMNHRIVLKDLESEIRERQTTISQSQERLLEIKKFLKESDESLKNLKEETEERNSQKTNLAGQIKKYDGLIIEVEEKIEEISKNTNEIQLNLSKIEGEEKSIYEEISKLERKEEQYSVRLEDLEEKLSEYKLDREEFFTTHPLPNQIGSETVKVLESKYKTLEKDLLSLGPVNENAIEEYNEISERLDFLRHQKNDLIVSKDKLEKIIKELEREMRQLFKEAISEIQVFFNDIFRQLFNGGNALVQLEEGEDLLEAGIEIQVQPPGKKLQSLTLLSGGERSMTAVALLFALLKRRISPFCILDEIDAALDEANIKRYTNYLKQMEKMQFIMITHRKTTMEIAERLYGVTMEEEGISSILSMKLEEAEDNARMAEEEI